MINVLAYFLLGAGAALFVYCYFDKSGKTMPLVFAATMFCLGGLVILQFVGSPAPGLVP
ncbi:MAG: hypothetical protein AAGA33_04615 [Pseudomonadota bacterium]